MAILEILQFPDPRLRTKAKPVAKDDVDAAFRAQVSDMYETMYHANGVGLAATQVNIHVQLFTMDISRERDQPVCILNPEIIHKEGIQYESEGCLSVAEAYDKVERALKVKLRGVDLDFKPVEIEAEGLMAVCFQHELDHLNGILFIDHLSKLKQSRIRTKIEKIQRRD
ncbi:MAG TPA: peptide deformylase [Gammaproteobacteria bacterium]|jgi:peptide deformylase|nr:peptide deformylase [Gammaproteobacteria bacterium]